MPCGPNLSRRQEKEATRDANRRSADGIGARVAVQQDETDDWHVVGVDSADERPSRAGHKRPERSLSGSRDLWGERIEGAQGLKGLKD
jgi:hypothetical protein